MLRSFRALLLLLLLAPRALAGGVQLAPPPGPQQDAPDAAQEPPAPSWKLCEVTASILATAPGRNILADEKKQFVYLGEQLDVEADVTVPVPQGVALVHARARLRAAFVTEKGVTYFITSDGIMRSTLGFQHPDTGKDQFRNEMMAVTDEATRLHEIYALPDLGLRVLMVVRVRPVQGRDEKTALELASPPELGVLRKFRVEALLKEGDLYRTVEQASLTTLDGREARLALTRFGVEADGASPVGLPGTSAVRFIPIAGVETKTAAEMGALTPVPADERFQERIEALQRSMHVDPTVDLGRKLPGQIEQQGTPRKISDRRRKRIMEHERQQEVREWAIEQSRSVPATEDVPEGYQREELDLVLTPLRATPQSLQLEIRLRGRVKLPKEEAFTVVDLTTTEQVRFGETVELGLAELVREDEPRYDYVLRITAEP